MNNSTNITDMILSHIKNGLFIEIQYKNKIQNKKYFDLVINSNILNDYNLYNKKLKPDIPFDIIRNKKFSFKDKEIFMIKYIGLPENYILGDDLNQNGEYLNNLITFILDQKINFSKFMTKFSSKNQNQIIITTYPNHDDYLKHIKNKNKNKLIEKYLSLEYEQHEIDNSSNNRDVKLLNSLKFLSIDIKNENVTDPIFINALRSKWIELINNHKKEIINKLTTESVMSNMSETEKEEYLIELKIFKKELKKDISPEVNKLNSLKEIISYYPTILYPTPYYVYDQY